MATIPDRALEEVYAVPPADFTRTRNARAAALAKAGEPEAAAALRKLRRPAATLWAANQLARLARTRVDAFIAAVAGLRRTQLRDPRAVPEAVQQQRTALDALLDVARTHLTEHGFGAGPAALGRIASTLQGAAVDPKRVDELRHGRLTEELAAPGFEVFADATPSPLKILPGGKSGKGTDPHQRAAERRARHEEARQQRARETDERERAARQRKAAEDAAAQEVQALAGKLADAKRRLSEARRGAKPPARKPRAAR